MSSEKSKKGLRLLQFYKKFDHGMLKLSQLWKGDLMPYSLKSCFAFIYHFNIDAKHVLRKNGNNVAQEVLFNFLKKNTSEAPTFYTTSVYDVCSALKAYVKDIPDGLLVKDIEHDWHKIVKLNNETKVKEKLKNIIQKLPSANKTMLFYLLFLASEVTERRQFNEMSVKGLSIVLMPSMFEKVVNITKVRDLNRFYDLLEFMIENARSIMSNEMYKIIGSELKNIGGHLSIVPRHDDTPSYLDEENKVQSVSQDSGLNSNSFIDHKGSESLSSLSRTNNTDQNISSMEDLLSLSENKSISIDRTRKTNVFRSSTIVGNKNKSDSKISQYMDHDRSISCVSSCSSISSKENNIQEPERKGLYNKGVKQRINQGFTCLGLNVHSIKECRPYSICGSPIHKHVNNTTKYFENLNEKKSYKTVYDRSFQNLDLLCDDYASTYHKTKEIYERFYLPTNNGIPKKTSSYIAPLEKFNNFLDSVSTPTTTSTITKILSTSASDNTLLMSLTQNFPTIKRAQVTLNQKLRVKKKSFLFKSRFSAPIKIEVVDVPATNQSIHVLRAVSFQQCQQKSKPLPLDKYLRQRSLEETFV